MAKIIDEPVELPKTPPRKQVTPQRYFDELGWHQSRMERKREDHDAWVAEVLASEPPSELEEDAIAAQYDG